MQRFPNGLYVNCGSCGVSEYSVSPFRLPGETENIYLCAGCLKTITDALKPLLASVIRGKPRKTLGYD